jgi:hypothetical protein
VICLACAGSFILIVHVVDKLIKRSFVRNR